jgi:site-specific DNA-methyltransferase (adenine-specific)
MPKLNAKNKIDCSKLMKDVGDGEASAVFLDPQYRGVLDQLNYGNEGERQTERAALPQMTGDKIDALIKDCIRALRPSGHLFLWTDKFGLINTLWDFENAKPVDMITWDKMKIGMGYRTRRRAEYLLIAQKLPLRAKGVWTDHGIPDVWQEKQDKGHPHAKPQELQRRLLKAVTEEGDLVVDPCAGGYGLLDSCKELGRNYLGGDLLR